MTNNKKKTIIVVGFRVDRKRNYITGQAVMIDLFIKIMKKNGYHVIPISLNYRFGGNTTVGKTSVLRLIDYILIFAEIFIKMMMHPKSSLYFSPVSNKSGSLRDFVVVKWAKLLGYRIFMQQFGCLFRNFYDTQSKGMQKRINWYYSNADVITVEGEKTKEQFKGLDCEKKLETLQNGLPELNIKTPSLPRKISKSKPIYLLYLSNMIESKGYLDVLGAINILCNEYDLPIHATFAGKFMKVVDDKKFTSPKEAEDYFFKRIADCNLKGKVSYYPSLFGKEKAKAFAQSHFFLLPTYYIFEGAPTAILEALAYGSVPVVTDHGLIKEMVNNENSIFVKKESPRDIADKILYCINNIDEYNNLSVNAYQRYRKNYTVAAYEKNLLNIYKNKIENETQK